MSKKICAITTVEITQINFVIPAMRMLKEYGYDVTIACNMSDEFVSRYGKEFKLINVPIHRGINIIDFFKMPLYFRGIFKKEKYELVQYATPNAALYASIGARLAGIKKRVYCQWGIRYVGCQGIMRRVLKCLEYITCKNSTHIRPASWKNLDYAVSEGLYPREKAAAIGDGGTVGIDLKEFDLSQKQSNKTAVIEQYPVLKGKTVFAFVGRLNADKGIFELLKAFKRLNERFADTSLLLIGNFDGNQPEEVQEILALPCVINTGWTNEVPKYLSAADVLVHPSYREGFSMVIQQAMAMAIPVITTDIPGPSEVIEAEVSGKLVSPRDIDDLYLAMEWMQHNPEKAKVMGQEGRLRCERFFSRDRMLRLILKDREQIINS